jgi:hypothetical protein
MKFSDWMILEQQEIVIPVKKLFGWRPKLMEAIQDIHDGLLSHSTGSPIIVSRLDSPRGSFFMMDGYHRVLESMMAGQLEIQAKIDLYTPRIERTGGAHQNMVNNKVRIVDVASQLKP